MMSLKVKSVDVNRVTTTRIGGNKERLCVPRGATVLCDWVSVYFRTGTWVTKG